MSCPEHKALRTALCSYAANPQRIADMSDADLEALAVKLARMMTDALCPIIDAVGKMEDDLESLLTAAEKEQLSHDSGNPPIP
jgi:hypothetical protein